MKQIENKTTEVENGLKTTSGDKIYFTYGDLIGISLNSKQAGITTSEMRMELAIFAAIEKQKKEFIENSEAKNIELEDAHFDYLKSLLPNVKWTVRHKDIPEFTDYINEIK